ncbi:MAG: biopolymer transporter ExbD [Kiritimatiellae bacterium]|nr:biopolymer transporter ExbD [Kiritimatiellia bacterium]
MSLRSRRRSSLDKSKAQIDMTSLIDLTFLLLVTFIITMPALEQGITVALPKGKTSSLPTKDNKATTITVDAQGRIYLNNNPIAMGELEAELKTRVEADPDVPVLVRGDENLTYGAVMDVVKLVYKCKVHRMALVTVED